MDRLGPLDAEFLFLEDDTNTLHIGACAVFDGPAPTFEEFVALTRSKLALVPRFRQLAHRVPFGIGRPVWVDDPDFDLDYHLRRVHLRPPGGTAQLRELGAHIMSQPLDRSRPLWEEWFVEGLPEGRWAVVSKVHHAMVDGVAGTELMEVLLDLDPDAPLAPVEPWTPVPAPNDTRLALEAFGGFLGDLRGQLRSLAGAVVRPQRLWDDVRHDVRALLTAANLLEPAPGTPLEGPIGPERSWWWTDVALDEIKAIKDQLGGTVNDVVLAAIAGGFRELLVSLGADPDAVTIDTLVPVSIRGEDEHGQFDNKVSGLFVELPVDIAHPQLRLEAVRDRMGVLKHSHEDDLVAGLINVAGLVLPGLMSVGSRASMGVLGHVGRLPVSTVTTNVPGPQITLYALGRRLRHYVPYVPIVHGVRVGVAILSYDGQVAFGITGDRATVPDLAPMTEGIRQAIADLAEVAAQRRGERAAG